jgi:hypothetical protein
MPKWVTTLVFIGCIVVLLVASRVLGARRAARRRLAFLNNRSPIPDDAFLTALTVTDQRHRRVARVIRHAVARELGLPPEMLHPDDEVRTLLLDLRYQIPDLLSAARRAIESELSTAYDANFEFEQSVEGVGPLDADTLRGFIGFYLIHLDRLTHAPAPA